MFSLLAYGLCLVVYHDRNCSALLVRKLRMLHLTMQNIYYRHPDVTVPNFSSHSQRICKWRLIHAETQSLKNWTYESGNNNNFDYNMMRISAKMIIDNLSAIVHAFA